MTTNPSRPIRVGIVVPHLFISKDVLPDVIFSPGQLALSLCSELELQGVDVTIYTPDSADTTVQNVTADMSHFRAELDGRKDSLTDLMKKHPLTFITLARQVQSELIAKAYQDANNDLLDVVHVYTNEEDTALPFAAFCLKPVVFTHHDPYNFLISYKNIFPKYPHLNWISLSLAQRSGMPENTNWIANIPHGLPADQFNFNSKPSNYVAYFGRIIEPKGVHIAIDAVKRFNKSSDEQLILKIAGKHYADHAKDSYWKEHIEPEIGETIHYEGFISDLDGKQRFLGNAKALLVPSIFEEPFGMVTIEALACGAPVIGLDRGATKEIIDHNVTGKIIRYATDEQSANDIANALQSIDQIERSVCREAFETKYTLQIMAMEHKKAYMRLLDNN